MPTQTILRLTIPDLIAAVRCTAEVAAEWIDPLSGAAFIYDINTPQRMAYWLATIAHESARLSKLEEDLNYSAGRLAQIWPGRFGPGKAEPRDYAHQPAKLASFVYANRMGNGPPETFDGWTYRGRGPIQLTGRDNYSAAAAGIHADIVRFPELVIEPPVGAMTAAWFWTTHGLNELADEDDFEGAVRRVNGGLTNYEDRQECLRRAEFAMERFR
jgi:putative chitinase